MRPLSALRLGLLLAFLLLHPGRPQGAERPPARESFKVVIAPVICRRSCQKGRCRDTCEQGSNTTLIGVNGQGADTLTGRGIKVVVCRHTCLNGGVCSQHSHCLCPPGFTGHLCQHPVHHISQPAQDSKSPSYTAKVVAESQAELAGAVRPMTQTRSVFTLPLAQGGGHHLSEVQFNVRVHHDPDTSVVIHPLDHSEPKTPVKPVHRLTPQTHKPRGRCFQETTPKQACSTNPLPGLTNQEDCCGSVGKSWGQNKCHKCPKLPYTGIHKQSIIEDYGSTCPQGYKRLNGTHCHDINECTMQGVCPNGECLNTQGSFRCTCKPGYVLERTRCVETPAEMGPCYRFVSEEGKCEHALPSELSREMCCCTVGKAWGNTCQKCPLDGTASFSKICPAGKGYMIQSIRETLSFPPQILQELQLPLLVPEEGDVTTPTQPPTVKVPVIKTKPTYVPIVEVPPEVDNSPLESGQTHLSLTDECRQNRNICGHGDCINGLSGFTCLCYNGYRPHAHRKSCEDEDECESNPCGIGRGFCTNTIGSYMCLCNHGYKLQIHNGRLTCVDVNECSKPHTCGAGSYCVNLPGSYKCECSEGYRSTQEAGCQDIDECVDPNTCPGERCENTIGSYECLPCLTGHQARAGVCYDIDECQKSDICPNGHCENLQGSYRCLCNDGFVPEPDGKRCHDLNECEDERLCANGRCVNTEGSFLCQCYLGYQPTQEGSHCKDINECEKPGYCQKGHCTNSMGSYLCECPKGYQLVNGRRCQDVDECAQDASLCRPRGVCENTQGDYMCICDLGYISSEDRHSCEKVEVEEKKECYLNLDDTVFCDSVLATNVTKQECCCSIGVGWGDQCEIFPCPVFNSVEFSLLCPTGRGFYHEDGRTKYGAPAHRDIDECVLFSDEVCKEGRCMNTQPGYECYCQQGFYYDGNLLECIDVDECHDRSLCANGRCVNTQGSFYCTCNTPWVPDASKKKCVVSTVSGVDECQDPTNCKNGRCVNTRSSFYCTCTLPWTLAADRNSCIPPEEQDDRTAAHKDVCFQQVDEDLICSRPLKNVMVTYSQCCCHYGLGWGPECRSCPQRNSVMFNRLCDMHLETESDGEVDFLAAFANNKPGESSEEDSDECSCVNGRCVRAYLGIMCECNPGFRLDHSRTRCTDIDECAGPSFRRFCKNAHCENTVGSFKCVCKIGFIPTNRPNICRPRTL